MSDNMEHIADFFKESGYRDRHFEPNEAGWDRLATALDQKKKRRWLPLWWSLGIVLLLGAGITFWLTLPTDEPVITQVPKPIQAEPDPEISTTQEAEQHLSLASTVLDDDPVTEADPMPGTTQETASNISTPTHTTKTVTTLKREVAAATSVEQLAPRDPGTTKSLLVANPVVREENESIAGTELPETITDQIQTSTSAAPLAVLKALPNAGEKSMTKTTLQSMTSHSIVQTSATQRRSARKPYPRPNAQQQTNSSSTTMQTMLGAPVYGSTILGEEINAWEQEKVGGRWQVALGIGTIPASYQGVMFFYSTDEIVGVFSTPYTRSDGSIIDLYPDINSTVRGNVAQNFNFYRLALYRDLGKGFGIKGSFLIATINDKTSSNLLNQAPNRPNVAYFTSNSRSTNLMAELGLQYTFYRRQRFQPYIGLSVFNVMVNSLRSERRFAWPGMGIDEVSSSSSSTSSTNFPGYYFELGMQYLPAPNWSVGPSFIITGTPFVEPQFGLGLEVRYRW
ncbi:MAG: hypothetical protein KTR30_25740 [Saprospiraceae bacterium]|nr:hypothetical protein [Saprospiraceae bacterium]